MDVSIIPAKLKNKECALYGLFIGTKSLFKERIKKFQVYIHYLLSDTSLSTSYKFKSNISGFVPAAFQAIEVKRKWPLIQLGKMLTSPLSDVDDLGMPVINLTQGKQQIKEQIKMYSDRIEQRAGVTITTCNRVTVAEPEGNSTSKYFIMDSGYVKKYDYKMQGTCHTFILNEFEDIKA